MLLCHLRSLAPIPRSVFSLHLSSSPSPLTSANFMAIAASPPPPPTPNHPSVSLLESCKSMKELKQIHSHMIRTGVAHSTLEQRRLLSFCCARDSGDMDYACLLFGRIRDPDLFVWNTVIKGYSNQSSPLSAVSIYVEMLSRGFEPDNYTFPFLLKAFDRETALACGDELHAHVLKFGLHSNPFVQNALVHMYALSGAIDTARELFDRSPKWDVVMWNAMISGYNRCKQYEESCKLFDNMDKEQVMPNSITIVSVLSACTKLRDLAFGTLVHRRIQDCGMVINLAVENALIDMYAGCGNMGSASMVFECMPCRDVISWTVMVAGFANAGQIDQARALFDQMPERDFISWTAMINGYVRASKFKEALEVFREMQATDTRADEFTIVGVLTACAHLGALEIGEWIHVYLERSKIKMDVFVGNSLVDMYSKCGAIDKAVDVFWRMNRRDKYTWTAMITGLAMNGNSKEALKLFYQMLSTSIRPDGVTYLGVLSACAHGGLVEKGRELFSTMITEHGIMPNVTHYGCLVDLLGRAGHLKEALETINNMPMKPNSTVWGGLLAACRAHKNIGMAELAANHLLELESENNAVYVLLSNVYAKCGMWKKVEEARNMIMERGIKKEPGCSLIEMNGTVHEFVAGDRSHPKSNEIYIKLEEMGTELKLAGYVPDTSEALFDLEEEERRRWSVYQHSERLAIAFGLISSSCGVTIRVAKNLRMCSDCHNAIKLVSKVYTREIIVRDRALFHHFSNGVCSCRDYW